MKNKPIMIVWILVLSVVFTAVLAVMAIPKQESTEAVDTQLAQTQRSIKNTTTSKIATKITSGSFNAAKEKRYASRALTTVFTDLFGGIKKESTLDKQRDKYQNLLGSSLTQHLFKTVELGKDDGTKYLLASKNNETFVSFGEVNTANLTVPVFVYVSYDQSNDRGDSLNTKQFFTLHYSLKQQRVLSFRDQVVPVKDGD